MIFKENVKVNLNGWSMRCKYISGGMMEDGLRNKAGNCALILHLPVKSARDVIRYYMIQSFPSNDFFTWKIDTLFQVIDQIFFLNSLHISYQES